jgi:hypothetical protein
VSRTSSRRGTKTRAIEMGKKGQAIKSRYSRVWKRDGAFQPVSLHLKNVARNEARRPKRVA